jgi:hypothetical protein
MILMENAKCRLDQLQPNQKEQKVDLCRKTTHIVVGNRDRSPMISLRFKLVLNHNPRARTDEH